MIPEQITPSAHKMIKVKGLVHVVGLVLQEIQALPTSPSRAREIKVEWEKDPEVEGWEMLSVTIWAEGSPKDARDLWRELDLAMAAFRQELPPADVKKLSQYVSVGVDIE